MIILKTTYKDGETTLTELKTMQEADKLIDRLNLRERIIIEHQICRLSLLYKNKGINHGAIK
jgi:hypothetical protein